MGRSMVEDDQDSVVSHKTVCPQCRAGGGDRRGDNLVMYTSGSGYCFACQYYEPGNCKQENEAMFEGEWDQDIKSSNSKGNLLTGEFRDLESRRISAKTCAYMGYRVNPERGVHIAEYRDTETGAVIAQKLRTPDKSMPWKGNPKHPNIGMFNQHNCKPNGKIGLVICEGEIDALTIGEAQKCKWPVVSVRNGASGAAQEVAEHLRWIEQFDHVKICMDMDKPGQEAAIAVARLLSPGKARIVSLPLKDPSDMMKAGRKSDLLDCLMKAKEWRPEGIYTLAELRDRVLRRPEEGLPWPYEGMTRMTHGRRPGEIYCFGAGVGMGKTDLLLDVVKHTVTVDNEAVACFFLETGIEEVGRRIVGKFSGRVYHIEDPDDPIDMEVFARDLDKVAEGDRLHLFDNFGVFEWDVLKGYIRWLNKAKGVKHFVIDHFTALTAMVEDERRSLDALLAELSGLAKELGLYIYAVSHLATPEGKPHEEGGRVYLRHFKGSRAIGQWVHYAFGLERNNQAEDIAERYTTTLRCLKARFDGSKTGSKIFLRYNDKEGRNHEIDDPGFGDNSAAGGYRGGDAW